MSGINREKIKSCLDYLGHDELSKGKAEWTDLFGDRFVDSDFPQKTATVGFDRYQFDRLVKVLNDAPTKGIPSDIFVDDENGYPTFEVEQLTSTRVVDIVPEDTSDKDNGRFSTKMAPAQVLQKLNKFKYFGCVENETTPVIDFAGHPDSGFILVFQLPTAAPAAAPATPIAGYKYYELPNDLPNMLVVRVWMTGPRTNPRISRFLITDLDPSDIAKAVSDNKNYCGEGIIFKSAANKDNEPSR